MPQAIRPVRVNHVNRVRKDFGATIAHLQTLHGANVLADYPPLEFAA